MHQRTVNKVIIVCHGGLVGGFVPWGLSYAIFYLLVIRPKKEMEPMLAASAFCGDCMAWGIVTISMMLLGVLIGAVVGFLCGASGTTARRRCCDE